MSCRAMLCRGFTSSIHYLNMIYYENCGGNIDNEYLSTELDDTLGDVQSAISDRQRALLLQVEDDLLDAEASLQQLSVTLSK